MRDVLVAWGRLPILALRAIADVLLSVIRLIGRLLGVRGPAPLAPLPLPDVTAGAVREDVSDGIAKVLRGGVQKPIYAPGYAVHAYASASAEARPAVDIDALSPAQAAWLISLAEEDLDRLQKAGAAACQRAVDGKKCGIVGLRVPGPADAVDPEEARLKRIREALRSRNLVRGGGAVVPEF